MLAPRKTYLEDELELKSYLVIQSLPISPSSGPAKGKFSGDERRVAKTAGSISRWGK